jgi:hypothetical protein
MRKLPDEIGFKAQKQRANMSLICLIPELPYIDRPSSEILHLGTNNGQKQAIEYKFTS